uniref:Uncharacterized protein LOC111119620 isoform X3 n=1 Tax=Crassostrea virginica TaxID=6565 RepID=A0A8B8CIM2_CRAVI|nr:uncharacterized protein LOC111119620 isoform X3 [Crassostrea virginica]
MGTPSMYPPGKSYYHDNQRRPQNMQRAISDDRLSPRYNRELLRHNKKDRESRSASLQRRPYYHDNYNVYYPYMVYQGNPHIYHSQQVPGSYEAFGRLPAAIATWSSTPPRPTRATPLEGTAECGILGQF